MSNKITFVALSASSSAGRPKAMNSVVKRFLDVTTSATLLLLTAPLSVLIAVAIKLESAGPVLFVQKAVGLNGREFQLLKFRSMKPGSRDQLHVVDLERNVRESAPTTLDVSGRPIFKTALSDASRITRVGNVIRRASLDELPQLWNVLVGDMTMVGPRPSLPSEVALYNAAQRQRLALKPGITGLYQVTARNRVPVSEMIRIDLEYARTRSLWLDLKLLARTPRAMFEGL